MNLIVQPRSGAAYLLTDTATYGPDGKVGYFRSKVLALSVSGRVSAALAVSGAGGAISLYEAHFRTLHAEDAESLLSAVPRIFREVKATLEARGVADNIYAVVALFDHFTGQPSGYVIGSDNSLFPMGLYRSGTLQPVRKYLTRYAGRPIPPDRDICDPRQWNPKIEGAALIEAQRDDLFGLPPTTFAAVGGQAILTRVSAEGIDQQILCAWPDRRGEEIDARGDRAVTVADHLRRRVRHFAKPHLPRVDMARLEPAPCEGLDQRRPLG